MTEPIANETPEVETQTIADSVGDTSADSVGDTSADSVGDTSADPVEVAADDYVVDETTGAATDDGEYAAPAAPIVLDGPIVTVGRRKEAVVRVRVSPGTGGFTLNGRSLEAYFPNKVHQQLIKAPLVLVERAESFDIIAKLHGGGPSGQAGALRLAIARALIEVQPDDRGVLKKAGYLTRDPRAVERKKYGLKKARKASQYSKR